jgi:hypothetical protein
MNSQVPIAGLIGPCATSGTTAAISAFMIRLHVWSIVLDLCISVEADRLAPSVVRCLRTLDREKTMFIPGPLISDVPLAGPHDSIAGQMPEREAKPQFFIMIAAIVGVAAAALALLRRPHAQRRQCVQGSVRLNEKLSA